MMFVYVNVLVVFVLPLEDIAEVKCVDKKLKLDFGYESKLSKPETV